MSETEKRELLVAELVDALKACRHALLAYTHAHQTLDLITEIQALIDRAEGRGQ